jgi:hypothetical protein
MISPGPEDRRFRGWKSAFTRKSTNGGGAVGHTWDSQPPRSSALRAERFTAAIGRSQTSPTAERGPCFSRIAALGRIMVRSVAGRRLRKPSPCERTRRSWSARPRRAYASAGTGGVWPRECCSSEPGVLAPRAKRLARLRNPELFREPTTYAGMPVLRYSQPGGDPHGGSAHRISPGAERARLRATVVGAGRRARRRTRLSQTGMLPRSRCPLRSTRLRRRVQQMPHVTHLVYQWKGCNVAWRNLASRLIG